MAAPDDHNWWCQKIHHPMPLTPPNRVCVATRPAWGCTDEETGEGVSRKGIDEKGKGREGVSRKGIDERNRREGESRKEVSRKRKEKGESLESDREK
jgi:hypothetical protein